MSTCRELENPVVFGFRDSVLGYQMDGYIWASGFVLYPYVLVVGPNKHGCSRRTRLRGVFCHKRPLVHRNQSPSSLGSTLVPSKREKCNSPSYLKAKTSEVRSSIAQKALICERSIGFDVFTDLTLLLSGHCSTFTDTRCRRQLIILCLFRGCSCSLIFSYECPPGGPRKKKSSNSASVSKGNRVFDTGVAEVTTYKTANGAYLLAEKELCWKLDTRLVRRLVMHLSSFSPCYITASGASRHVPL